MWQSCGWKMVCDKIVCEWWRVKKWCVCQIVCVCVWQMVCGRWHVMQVCLANLCLIDCVWPRLCVCRSCVCLRDAVLRRWCVTDFSCGKNVKDGVRQRWCVTELWAKNAVCVSTMVCGKVGHDNVHVTKVCAKEGVCVWQRYDRSSGATKWRKLCVKICCGTKNVWQTKCVAKLREKKRWAKDGVWLRWRLTKIK